MPAAPSSIENKIYDAIGSSRSALILEHPFWAVVSMHIDVVAMPDTMSAKWGIDIAATDGKKLYFTSRWLDLPPRQQLGLFAHELGHCLLFHVIRGVGKAYAIIWNIAIDHSINLILIESGMELPLGACADPSFRGMDADTIYRHLVELYESGAMRVEGMMDHKDDPKDDNGDIPVLGRDISYNEARERGVKVSAIQASDSVMDPRKDPETGEDLGAEDHILGQLSAHWSSVAAQALKAARMAGKVPAGIEVLIERTNRPRISLKRSLARFITNRAKPGRNWAKPHRKWIQEDLHMPSRMRPGIKDLMVVIDTSLSVDETWLARFLSIVNHCTNCYHATVHLYSMDQVLKLEGIYGNGRSLPKKVVLTGRGGTSFVAPFMMAEERSRCTPSKKFQGVVYLTDGFGNYPETTGMHTPPTIWVLSQEHLPGTEYYPPFGEVCYLYD